ncbi:hypothetical protein MJG53_000885, partial [Ovis ammon polii x Ovis aries]
NIDIQPHSNIQMLAYWRGAQNKPISFIHDLFIFCLITVERDEDAEETTVDFQQLSPIYSHDHEENVSYSSNEQRRRFSESRSLTPKQRKVYLPKQWFLKTQILAISSVHGSLGKYLLNELKSFYVLSILSAHVIGNISQLTPSSLPISLLDIRGTQDTLQRRAPNMLHIYNTKEKGATTAATRSLTGGFIGLEKGEGGARERRRIPGQKSKFRGTGPAELWKQESGMGCMGSKSQGFHGWQASSRKFS